MLKPKSRHARSDVPGALHHIMIRGIDTTNIFRDAEDKISAVISKLLTLQAILVQHHTGGGKNLEPSRQRNAGSNVPSVPKVHKRIMTASTSQPNKAVTPNSTLFWSLFCLPIATTVFLSWLFFIPLPIYDYWDVLNAGFHLQDKTVWEQLRYLWEPFVDQKMVFSKLLIIWLARATQNHHYWLEIIFGLLGQLVVLAALAYLITTTRSLASGVRTNLLLISSFLLFWPNLLLRFQLHWYSTQYTFVLVFAILSVTFISLLWGTWAGVWLSLIFGIFSAFSHGTGLIYLLGYMIVLPFAPGWSRSQKLTACLGAVATISIIAAQMPDRAAIDLPPLNWFTDKPIQELIYIFRCFGPQGVLRSQTGFLTLVCGALSCWVLMKKNELFSKEYCPWVLLFFWGCCAAGVSGITRSSFAKYPSGIYFSFFVLVLAAVIVLIAVALPHSPLKDRKINWRIVGTICAVLYIVGAVDGIRIASSTQQKIFWSRERLRFQPILVQNDYQWLFPLTRFPATLSDLSARHMLDDVDTRPFTAARPVHFSEQTGDREIIYIPERPLSPDEVITFPASPYANLPARCYWTADSTWNDEQSQELQMRLVNGSYWIIFKNRKIPGFNTSIRKIRLVFSGDGSRQDIANLPGPVVRGRNPASK
jgi:hypothetical protein